MKNKGAEKEKISLKNVIKCLNIASLWVINSKHVTLENHNIYPCLELKYSIINTKSQILTLPSMVFITFSINTVTIY